MVGDPCEVGNDREMGPNVRQSQPQGGCGGCLRGEGTGEHKGEGGVGSPFADFIPRSAADTEKPTFNLSHSDVTGGMFGDRWNVRCIDRI